MSERAQGSRLLPALVYAALSTAIVSSLGMLLVPTISSEFHVTISTAQWMLTINLLVGAIVTPVMGRLSDGPHKKRLLVGALTTILVGSIIAALADTFAVFLIGRALQGLSYGIVPMTIALARRYMPVERSTQGIASLSVTVATGMGIGYPLTGLIAGTLDYQFAFWFAAAFIVSAMIVVTLAVPSGPDDRAPRVRFDVPGATVLAFGLAALLLAVSEGEIWGWAALPTLSCFALAIVLLTVWALLELKVRHPLINLRVLRSPDALVANLTAITLGTVMYMVLSIGSIIAQAPDETGYGIALPVFWAGFVMLPFSVGSFTANRIVRRLAKRIQMTALLPLGASLVTAASLLLLFAHRELWEILLGMFLIGMGVGTTYAAMPALIALTVATDELGSAVSFNQVLRTVGGSFGSAISGAVLAAHLGSDGHPTASGIFLALAISAIGCAAVLVGLLIDRARGTHEAG
ncbi:MFS transporter [Brevibacterium marinum]|uniref:Putative MFS family arabinose efflux permease n=1 Tax=Brevibacterium marinum TaxID=418643 RepID=A0A846RMW2_9MICO|nr:MFS transporter [Brevibacterium marinum]NJC55049.1 putative MFS family arabinose efflux permease [Brevibacterium marinum]